MDNNDDNDQQSLTKWFAARQKDDARHSKVMSGLRREEAQAIRSGSAARRQANQDLAKSSKKLGTVMDNLGRTTTGGAQKVADGLRLLDDNTRSFGRAVQGMVKNIAIFGALGVVVSEMVNLGEHWVRNYREVASVGQTFNGSMSAMARAAADAGMPLQEFSRYVKANAKVMAVYGAQDVTKLSLNVRRVSRSMGNYAYSVEDMADLTATWLDFQRLQGNRMAATNASSAYAVDRFAQNITGISQALGQSREEILNVTKRLMTDGVVGMTAMVDPALAGQEGFLEAMTYFGALPGKAGEIMSELAQAEAASPGMGAFTDAFRSLQMANLGGVVGDLQNMFTSIRNGANGVQSAQDVTTQLYEAIEAQGQHIVRQAQVLPDLKPLADFYTAMKGLEGRDPLELEQMKKASALFATLTDRLNDIKGRVLTGILNVVEDWENSITDIDWKAVLAGAERFGVMLGHVTEWAFESFATFFKGMQQADWSELGKALANTASLLGRFIKSVMNSFTTAFGGEAKSAETAMKTVTAAFNSLFFVLEVVANATGMVVRGFQWLHDGLNQISDGLGSTVLAFGVAAAWLTKTFVGTFVRGMTVNAAHVSVNGPGFGMGMGKGKGRLGRMGAGALGFLKKNKMLAGILAVSALGAAGWAKNKAFDDNDDEGVDEQKKTNAHLTEMTRINKEMTELQKAGLNKHALSDGSLLSYARDGSPLDPETEKRLRLKDPTPKEDEDAELAQVKQAGGDTGGNFFDDMGIFGTLAMYAGVDWGVRKGWNKMFGDKADSGLTNANDNDDEKKKKPKKATPKAANDGDEPERKKNSRRQTLKKLGKGAWNHTKGLKGAGLLGSLFGLASEGAQYADGSLDFTGKNLARSGGRLAATGAGAALGAKAGAMLGILGGPLGVGIGGVAGGLIGGGLGAFGGDKLVTSLLGDFNSERKTQTVAGSAKPRDKTGELARKSTESTRILEERLPTATERGTEAANAEQMRNLMKRVADLNEAMIHRDAERWSYDKRVNNNFIAIMRDIRDGKSKRA